MTEDLKNFNSPVPNQEQQETPPILHPDIMNSLLCLQPAYSLIRCFSHCLSLPYVPNDAPSSFAPRPHLQLGCLLAIQLLHHTILHAHCGDILDICSGSRNARPEAPLGLEGRPQVWEGLKVQNAGHPKHSFPKLQGFADCKTATTAIRQQSASPSSVA